jgi:DNA-binding GntR family transcriptional regulator
MNTKIKVEKESVYQDLCQRIINEDLKSGQRLIERDICEQYGLSRTPLREVMWHLESDGLLEQIPGTGFIVKRMTLENIVEIFQARESIEGISARLCCKNNDDLFRSKLQYLRSQFEMVDLETEMTKYSKMGKEMHSLIINEANNSLLLEFYKKLSLLHSMATNIATKSINIEQDAREYHIKIIDAILKQDGDLAEKMMREHLRVACRLISKTFYPMLFDET